MKITNHKFKDVDGLRITGKNFEAIFLPENGGKLVSFVDRTNHIEWLAQDINEKYIPQSVDGVYVDAEVSGADEMFPTIDPCNIMGKDYPCHGEVCRVSHQAVISDNKLILKNTSHKFSYVYKKTVSETSCGNMRIEYEIENTGDEILPCLWAFHMMFAAEDGGKVFASVCENADAEIMFDDRKRFGTRGDVINLKEEHFISREYKEKGDAYKYYIKEPLKEGLCGYYRKNRACGVALCYDKEKLPYLGIWMNDGGFKNMHSATVEPCNIPYDSPEKANDRGIKFSIPPKKKMNFEIVMKIINEPIG